MFDLNVRDLKQFYLYLLDCAIRKEAAYLLIKAQLFFFLSSNNLIIINLQLLRELLISILNNKFGEEGCF